MEFDLNFDHCPKRATGLEQDHILIDVKTKKGKKRKNSNKDILSHMQTLKALIIIGKISVL